MCMGSQPVTRMYQDLLGHWRELRQWLLGLLGGLLLLLSGLLGRLSSFSMGPSS
uniref:Uncharacterized protein n=1 Tax=Arundo donax TaxID=35708 RepID=A0A0A9BLB8_ARUDO